MPGPGNVAAALATQREYIDPKVNILVPAHSVLFKEIDENTKIHPVSNRPFRVPMQPTRASKVRTSSFDGAGMGLGVGPQTVPATGTCVGLVQASQWTALADYTTDNNQKSVEDYVTLLESQRVETMAATLDIVLQGDGSGWVDTAVTVAGALVTVNNANLFLAGWDVDCWTANYDQGGTYLGTATVVSTDPQNAQVLFQNLPAAVTTGTRFYIAGSSTVTNSHILGLRYWLQAGNTGTWANIQKSSYPGSFNVPNVNAPNALTPQIVRLVESLQTVAQGEDEPDKSRLVMHCNVDALNQWENNFLVVQRADIQQSRREESADMLPRKRMKTIGGIPALLNIRARPGYIDALDLSTFWQVQSKALSLFENKGQTTFVAYAEDGSVATSFLQYTIIMFQIMAVQPQKNFFVSGLPVSKGLFGH